MEKFEMTGNKDLDELLKRINDGESVNIQNKFGYTVLTWTSCLNKIDVVKKILKHPDININIQDKHGNIALIWASYNGRIGIVKELLKHPNINIDIKDNVNKTALDYAIEEDYYEIISLIQTYSYIKENKELFTQLGIDNSIVETVISADNCFETNKQNIDSLIRQYSNIVSVSVVETDEL